MRRVKSKRSTKKVVAKARARAALKEGMALRLAVAETRAARSDKSWFLAYPRLVRSFLANLGKDVTYDYAIPGFRRTLPRIRRVSAKK